MKKIYFILAILILSASCMGKYENQVKDLANRIEALESKIPTIEDQVAAIKQSINLLNDVDKALQTSISALDSADKELENSGQSLKSIQNELTTSLQQLQQYVDDELIGAENWVNTTIMTLEQYNSLVSTIARLENTIESNGELASQELTEAIDALNDSFKSWVGEQLLGYYTIAKADAEFDEVRKSIKEGDERLQGEINDLESQITSAAATLTEAYENAIKEAINEYNGIITAELSNVNKRLDEEIATINAKLATLEAQINQNSEDIANLLARIQSLSYIHKYDDGKATMRQRDDLRHAALQFEVSPKECVAALEENWESVLSAKGVCIIDDHKEFESDMPILKFEADKENGIIVVTVSGENYPNWAFIEQVETFVTVTIANNATSFISDPIPMAICDYGGFDELIIPNNELWYVTSDEKPITLGSSPFGTNVTIVSHIYEEGFGRIVASQDIVQLGVETFKESSTMLSIKIPDSVQDIPAMVFSECSELREFIHKTASADGRYLVDNNTILHIAAGGLTELNIPDNITSIGAQAFYGCSGLKRINIPDSITSIGAQAFYGCSGLERINIPDSITSIGAQAFYGCAGELVINNQSLTETDYTFLDYPVQNSDHWLYGSNFSSVVIGDDITKIGNHFFYGYSCLDSITIPNSVTAIGEQAFSLCRSLISVYISDLSAWCRISFEDSLANPLFYDGNLYLNNELVKDLVIPSDITEIKRFAFSGCTSLTSVTIPNSVTSIGRFAFENCSSLTSVTIPNSVTSIGGFAFCDCTGLTSVTIPNSVTSIEGYAFYGCTGLTSVSIPDSVTTIGKCVFLDCESLTSVTIPNSVTTIGMRAFENCSSLTSVTIPGSVTTIGEGAFENCSSLTSVTIPNSVTSIEGNTFCGCTGLTSVTIPKSVTTIGNRAFSGCTGLTSVTIPNSVTSIGEYAFYRCTAIDRANIHINKLEDFSQKNKWFADLNNKYLFIDGKEVTEFVVPSNITSIEEEYFAGWVGLTSITIPDSVTSIGNSAFRYCTGELIINSKTLVENNYTASNYPTKSGWLYDSSFKKLTIGDNITTIGKYAFKGYSSLTSITIPNSVTTIGYEAFENCSSLTSVTIPDSVTTIEGWAFSGCSSLTSVYITDLSAWCRIGFEESANPLSYAKNLYINNELAIDIAIPRDITEVKNRTFYGCSSLISVTIPGTITSIGGYAFSGCTGLTSVTIPKSVTMIGAGAFYNCSSLTSITIPKSVTTIGGAAFKNCSSLTSVTIPDSVTSIGGSTFENCSSLTSVTIPNSVTEIGSYAFYNCSSLTSVNIGDSVTEIGSYAFYNCRNLTSVTIGDSVTTIGDMAFRYCTGELIINSKTLVGKNYTTSNYPAKSGWLYEVRFNKLTIGDNITRIGDCAFAACRSLTSVTIPDSVTSIGNSAFGTCTCLTSVTIPERVTSIGDSAFYNCSSLTSVYCKRRTPPTGGSSMFNSNAYGRNIYVPTESVNAYKLCS